MVMLVCKLQRFQSTFNLAVLYTGKTLFLKDGLKAWEGTKEEIFRTDNKAVVDFVYSSNLFKKVREAVLNGH